MIRPVPVLAALFLLSASAVHADDGGFLKGFAGKWRGTGAVRTADDKPQEKLVCRVEGAVDGSGDALQLSGRCGGEKFTGSFSISLTYNPDVRKYYAVWRDSLGGKSPPLTGMRSGSQLVFKIRHNDFETKGRAISTLVVDPKTSRLHVVGRTEPAAGTGAFESANLVFVKG